MDLECVTDADYSIRSTELIGNAHDVREVALLFNHEYRAGLLRQRPDRFNVLAQLITLSWLT